jgi:hypothetical protein
MKSHASTHTRRIALAAVATAAASLLAACGGGGGSGTTAPAATTSTTSFALGAALASFVKDTRTASFTVSGTGSNGSQTITVSGSGTAAESAVLGTFEGAAAYNKTSSLVGSLTVQGTTNPLNTSGVDNYDLNFKPVGSTSASSYCVTTSYVALPATVRVGDTGSWYEQTCYTNASKTTKVLTLAVSFQIETDTASTALWRIQQRATTTAGVTTSGTAAYRITPSGGVSLASSASSATISGVTTNLVFTYQ